jgi:hypothetical protein
MGGPDASGITITLVFVAEYVQEGGKLAALARQVATAS